jgi:RNA polymerase sigma factor (sigma-70 family)
MTSAKSMGATIQSLRTVLAGTQSAGTDGELVLRFVKAQDEGALAGLIRRLAPMVWNVCRRTLSNHHDAEDAFQATFLVLVRKASTLRDREKVANWLYGVAIRTATRLRAAAAKRTRRERQDVTLPEKAEPEQVRNNLIKVLDQELSRLPDKHRDIIVLCDLNGRSRKEVAAQLGCPEGTVASRLARARVILAKRLERHGLAVSGGLLSTLLAQDAASACVPQSVILSCIKAASNLAGGKPLADVVAASVVALTEGVLKDMVYCKLKLALGLLLGLATCACIALAAGGAFSSQQREDPQRQPAGKEKAGFSDNLESWWRDLASPEEAKANRALLAFASSSKESTAFFKERLKPVKVDAGLIKKLVAQLDSDQYATREAAGKRLTEEVSYLGKFVRPTLLDQMKGKLSPEAGRRVQQLIAQLPDGPKPDAKLAAPLLGAKGKVDAKIVNGQVEITIDGQPLKLGNLPFGQANSVDVKNVNGQVEIIINGQPLDFAALAKGGAPAANPPAPNPQWLRAGRAISLLESFQTPEARAILEEIASRGEPEAGPTQEAKAALKRMATLKSP